MAACRVLLGKTTTLFYDECLDGTGVLELEFVLDDADTLLSSLYIDTLTAGTIEAKVYTVTDKGEEKEIISFPVISAPTTELLLKKAAVGLSNMRLEITYTGVTDGCFSFHGKGLTVGETETKILGAADGKASKLTVTTSAGVLIPSSFDDRAGLVIKNYNTSGIMYLGYTLAEATVANGYPIGPGESIGIDLAADATLYAIGTVSIDVRVMEAAN